MVLEKSFCLQVMKMEKNNPFIFLAQQVWVPYLWLMSNIFSVCLVYPVYDEHMSYVLAIRSHTMKFFNII